MRRILKIFLLLTASTSFATEYNAWVKPIYYSDQQYADNSVYGYLTNSAGISAGLDKNTTEYGKIGLGFGYFNAKQKDINSTASFNDLNTYQIIAYGQYDFAKSSTFEWLASIGANNYKSTRAVTSTLLATGSYTGQQYLARAIVSKAYRSERLNFIPQLSANVIYLHQNAFNEQGAGAFNQRIVANNAGVFMLGTGFKIDGQYRRNKYNLSPELRCLLFYDIFTADINALTAFLIGGPALTTSSTPGRASGQLGASLTSNMSKAMQIILSYDLLLRASYFNNVVALKFNYAF